jgi:HSP20 family molecular chaperone IbpA
MEKSLARNAGAEDAAVAIVPAQVLTDRMSEIRDMIASRAYELYEARGGSHGRDIEDWTQAEHEIMHLCRHDIRESDDAVILHAQIPGSQADQLEVSIEPRRLMVNGTISLDARRIPAEPRKQRIFRLHELPAEVNPLSATAVLKNHTLIVTMPKVIADKPRTQTTNAAG